MQHADEYIGALQKDNIVLPVNDRQQLIWEAVEATAGLVGGELPRAAAQELLDEHFAARLQLFVLGNVKLKVLQLLVAFCESLI